MVIADTGEVAGDLRQGDRIYRKASDEYLKNTILLNPTEAHTKIFFQPVEALVKELSPTELQVFFFLMGHISYETGIVAHFPNGKPMTRKTLASAMGVSIKTVDRTFNSLLQKEVIGKHKSGHSVYFTVNPWLLMRGRRISRDLYDEYKKSRWATYYLKGGGTIER